MQNFRVNITKGLKKAKHRDGRITFHKRYLVHYNDPSTGKRVEHRFKTLKEAEAEQNALIRNWENLARRKNQPPTLKEAVEYWLKSRENVISSHAHHAYKQVAFDYILGPSFLGTSHQRRQYGMTGELPQDVQLIPMLGTQTRIDQITTSQIRTWYLKVLEITTPYVAKSAMKYLSSVFRLIEEDFELRLARMPSRPGPSYRRKKRTLLSEAQIKLILEEAQRDKKWGAYYAFLILTGVRPSEMLGMLWENLDLDKRRIYIHGTQDINGRLKEFTKTDAGMREVPMNTLLRDMLLEWRERYPRFEGKPDRVFPAQAHESGWGAKPMPNSDHGLTVNNFRNRVWYPLLKRLGLPQISLYAVRHMAISYLQAQGVEIGLVAKIAGHSSPQITLQYYTHAVREYEGVMDELNAAYGLEERTPTKEMEVQI